MPTTIKLKNSVTTTNAPSSLVQGEVAINITDKKVWVGNAATTPVQLLGDGGSASFTSIAFGAGTVSNPSITFTGDTNTGIYSPAADTIAFTEGGVEAMRIDSSGNVGIGTSSPTALLHVNGTARAVSMSLNGVTLSDYNLYSGLVTRVSNGGGIGINSANASDNAYIYFGTGTSSSAQQSAAIGRIGGDVLSFFTASSERMRITSGGDLCIGCTGLSSDRPDVAGGTVKQTNGNTKVRVTTDGNPAFQFYSPTGGTTTVGRIDINASSTTYVTSSDYRLKENIAPMTGALETVAKLNPVTYDWKVGGSSQGFIAHELAEVFPEAVSGEKDAVNKDGSIKPQGIDTSFLVATLTAAIQEQQAMIEELKAEVALLKSK